MFIYFFVMDECMDYSDYPNIAPHAEYRYLVDNEAETVFSLLLERVTPVGETTVPYHQVKMVIRNYRDNLFINPDISVLDKMSEVMGSLQDIKQTNPRSKKWVRVIGETGIATLRFEISRTQVTLVYKNTKMFLMSTKSVNDVMRFLNWLDSIKETIENWQFHGTIVEPKDYARDLQLPSAYYRGMVNKTNVGTLESSFTPISVNLKARDIKEQREHTLVLRFGWHRLMVRDMLDGAHPFERQRSVLLEEFLVSVQNALQKLVRVIIIDPNVEKNHYVHIGVDQDLLLGTGYFNAAVKIKEANTYVGLLKTPNGIGYTTVINSDLISPHSKISINSAYADLDDVLSLLGHALAHLPK